MPNRDIHAILNKEFTPSYRVHYTLAKSVLERCILSRYTPQQLLLSYALRAVESLHALSLKYWDHVYNFAVKWHNIDYFITKKLFQRPRSNLKCSSVHFCGTTRMTCLLVGELYVTACFRIAGKVTLM